MTPQSEPGLHSTDASRWISRAIGTIPWATVASLGIALMLWEVFGRTMEWRALPAFSEVIDAWLALSGDTLKAVLWNSARTFLIGFSSAVIAAVFTAVLTSVSKTAYQVLETYIDAGMSIPITATVPVLMLIFGLGDLTRIIVVFLFAYFVMVISMQAGIEKVDPAHEGMAAAFAADRRQVLRYITIPSAFPLAMTGIRLGVTRGLKGLVNAEVIISTAGIGWLLIRSARLFDIASVYAITGTIVVVSATLTGLLVVIERRLYRSESAT